MREGYGSWSEGSVDVMGVFRIFINTIILISLTFEKGSFQIKKHQSLINNGTLVIRVILKERGQHEISPDSVREVSRNSVLHARRGK